MTTSEEASFIPKSFEVDRPLVNVGSFSDISNQHKAKKTNICIAALSIINTMVGGGILVLPKSTQNIGIVLSKSLLIQVMALLLIIGFINLLSGYLLIYAADITKKTSYSDLSYFSMGRCSIFLQGVAIVICYYPMIIVYICKLQIKIEIFSSAFSQILLQSFGVKQITIDGLSWYRVGVLILFVLEFALMLPKHLVQIKVASIFSFLGISIFTVFLVYLLFSGKSQYSPEDVEDYLFVNPSYAMIASTAAIVTAYGFQPVVYPVYLGLQNRNPKRGNQFMLIAVVLTSLLYALICLLAVFCYPNDNMSGNILRTISHYAAGQISLIPNIVYLVLMAMHLPILFFMTKEAILIMIDECMRRSVSRQQDFIQRGYFTLLQGQILEVLPYVTMNPVIYYVVTVLTWASASAFGFYNLSIEIVRFNQSKIVQYIGAFGMSFLSFIIPAMYFLIVVKKTQTKVSGWDKCGAWFSLIFGVIAMGFTITANLIESFRS